MLKKPIINTLWQILGKAGMVLIGLVTTGILTRKLGVEVYGSYTLLISVFLLLDALADFGTKIISVREISGAEGDEKRKIFVQAVWLRLMMTGMAFILGTILILVWKGFVGMRLEAFLSLLMIWLTSIGGTIEIVFQTRMRMDLKIIMDIIFPLSFLILIWVWPGMIGLKMVFIGYLMARLLSLVVGVKLVSGFKKIVLLRNVNFSKIKEILKLSWPMGLYLITFSSYDRVVDTMMIQRFVGVKELAWYGLAYKIYSTLLQPAYFFMISIFPLISIKTVDKKQIFWRALWLLSGGVVLLVTLVYWLAPWIIGILGGADFEPSVLILRILLVAVFFSYFGHLMGFTLISQGRQKAMLKLSLITLTFNIVANLWAIPRYGIVAAAIVTGLTEALGLGLMGWRLVKSSKNL